MGPAGAPASAPIAPSSASSARRPCCPRPTSPASAATRAEVDEVARDYWDAGVRQIVALRGDPPKETATPCAPRRMATAMPPTWSAASSASPISRSRVAAFPEGHPESTSVYDDLDNLKRKIDAGASRAITQFFFENDIYFRYLERCHKAGITCEIVPGIMPVTNFRQMTGFAATARRERAPLDGHPVRGAGRRSRDAEADRRHGGGGTGAGPRRAGRARVPLLHAQPRRPHVRDLSPARPPRASRGGPGVSVACSTHTHVGARPVPSWTPDPSRIPTPWTRASRLAALETLLRQRILVLDGAMGTMIQAYLLQEADFRGERFADWHKDLRGNNDVLALTRPDIIQDLHAAYLEAGADILETNTFTTNAIAMADYGMESLARELNVAAARIARSVADAFESARPDRPRYVAGVLGPTNRAASMSPDVNDPGYRATSRSTSWSPPTPRPPRPSSRAAPTCS